MYIDVFDAKVQDACFQFLRLLDGRCGEREAERTFKEIMAAVACRMARPSRKPRGGSDIENSMNALPHFRGHVDDDL